MATSALIAVPKTNRLQPRIDRARQAMARSSGLRVVLMRGGKRKAFAVSADDAAIRRHPVSTLGLSEAQVRDLAGRLSDFRGRRWPAFAHSVRGIQDQPVCQVACCCWSKRSASKSASGASC